jgi:hypothetical protein
MKVVEPQKDLRRIKLCPEKCQDRLPISRVDFSREKAFKTDLCSVNPGSPPML